MANKNKSSFEGENIQTQYGVLGYRIVFFFFCDIKIANRIE